MTDTSERLPSETVQRFFDARARMEGKLPSCKYGSATQLALNADGKVEMTLETYDAITASWAANVDIIQQAHVRAMRATSWKSTDSGDVTSDTIIEDILDIIEPVAFLIPEAPIG